MDKNLLEWSEAIERADDWQIDISNKRMQLFMGCSYFNIYINLAQLSYFFEWNRWKKC